MSDKFRTIGISSQSTNKEIQRHLVKKKFKEFVEGNTKNNVFTDSNLSNCINALTMEDEAPIIYGLEFQARALCPQVAETEAARFFVGTQSLKFENQIHQLEYDEENNALAKKVFLHGAGEVWHIAGSPTIPEYLSTCYNHITPDGKCEMEGAIWKLPATVEENDAPNDDGSSAIPCIELVTKLETSNYGTEVKSIIWHPLEGNKLISLVDNHFLLWDINRTSAKLLTSATADLKGKPKFTAIQWNSHQNCSHVATAIDTSVRGWDLRSMQQVWLIEGAHGQLVRELDFNPNRQYYLATCGDDCQAKFWDTRNTHSPIMVLSNHSHWIWSVRYNHFHDQLILTSSSDSRVVLSRVASISSEPFGHLVEDEDILLSMEDGEQEKKVLHDTVIATYEEHEDSVYATEWSSVDPWLFASLSYDGRLVINKVPRAEKYRILL